MANTHTHTLTFTGMVPATEMDRVAIYSGEVREARDALLKALDAAGFKHTVEQTVKAPRKTRAPKPAPVRAAAAA